MEGNTDNELIAEFMGWERISNEYSKNSFMVPNTYPQVWFDSGEIQCKPEKMSFHDRWDWLMPVVEKIESLQYKKYLYVISGYTFVINGRCAEVMDIERDTITKQQVGESKIEATYKAVVEFVKWYSRQKEK